MVACRSMTFAFAIAHSSGLTANRWRRDAPAAIRAFTGSLELVLRHQLLDDLIDAEARRLLPWRKLLEAREPLVNDRLCGVLERDVLDEPVVVLEALLAALEG